jgi:hypothetical protein
LSFFVQGSFLFFNSDFQHQKFDDKFQDYLFVFQEYLVILSIGFEEFNFCFGEAKLFVALEVTLRVNFFFDKLNYFVVIQKQQREVVVEIFVGKSEITQELKNLFQPVVLALKNLNLPSDFFDFLDLLGQFFCSIFFF